MAGRFIPARGLDGQVAARFLRPAIARIVDDLAEAIRRKAPPGKVWITRRDERVRHSHEAADNQLVPANLRYVLPVPGSSSMEGDTELAKAPRDPDLQIGNRIACRCVSVTVPEAIRERVTASAVSVRGTRVSGRVTVTFPRVVESNSPSSPDSGGQWVQAAVREVLASSRARR